MRVREVLLKVVVPEDLDAGFIEAMAFSDGDDNCPVEPMPLVDVVGDMVREATNKEAEFFFD